MVGETFLEVWMILNVFILGSTWVTLKYRAKSFGGNATASQHPGRSVVPGAP